MFKKIKSILFEEVEIEEEQPLDLTLQNEQPKIRRVEPITPKVVKEETVEMDETPSKGVVRIDLTAAQKLIKDEKPEGAPPVFEPEKKPATTISSKAPIKRPQAYRPKPVISPMFGMTDQERQRTEQLEAMKPQPTKREDISVISPIYGEVDYKEVKPVKKRRRRGTAVSKKDSDQNLTLEEMLNLDHQQDLEFTLFDVELDETEFQSREHVRFSDEEDTFNNE